MILGRAILSGLTPAMRVVIGLTLVAVAAGVIAGCSDAGDDRSPEVAQDIPLAPGYGPLGFEAPEPGTYSLPSLGDAADGPLLASDGSPTTLHAVFGSKVTILSLMYANCSDVNGCPLATAVLHQISSRMKKDEELAEGLRLISLSFDPARDTPQVMRQYASHHVGKGVDWQFLTTASEAVLRPILADYGQSLIPQIDNAGVSTDALSHLLRVFLIDSKRRIRNIYSVSYLHADTLVSDVKTLLMERAEQNVSTLPVDSVDLVGRASQIQLGLPRLSIPADNPLTPEKVKLGRKLFYDRRLSLNATLSCGMCHVPEQGFTNNELATAVGIEGRTVRRNAPTLLNVAFATSLFHDGRENRLENQVWGPLLAPNEMGNPSVGAVLERIRGIAGYEALFSDAFPNRGLAIETVGMSIASYERTLVAGDSAFDRWYFADDKAELSDQAARGFGLFSGKAGCVGCHSIGAESALFADGELHHTGIGYRASMQDDPQTYPIRLAPGESVSVDSELIARVSETPPDDLGLYEITQNPDDRWKYKTPSLRNIALTAPYMHDGSLSTLREVVEFYDGGGVPNQLLDRRIHRLDLTDAEISQIVSFLESLTGSDVDLLIADASAVRAGDIVGEVAER